MKEGTHSLKIRVTGTKNARATGTYVVLDYIRVYTATLVNTASGYQSLVSNTSGANNTAYGVQTLYSNTSGAGNTALGSYALKSNTTGIENTAVGDQALYSNTEGIGNSALGYKGLFSNTTGTGNTAHGHQALKSNISGHGNTATGIYALEYNSTGSNNTGIGANALSRNYSGSQNTALGNDALSEISTEWGNTAVGNEALSRMKGSYNTSLGDAALKELEIGNNNTAVGAFAGVPRDETQGPRPSIPQFDNTTALGYAAKVTASDQVRIGNTYVTSIGGQVSWSTLSDGRFKKEIKEDVSGLEFIDKLRPVSYSVDKEAVNKFLRVPSNTDNSAEARKKGTRQTGFIAQEVEDVIKKTGYVFHGIEAPKNEGDHYSIRYAEFVVPLVKAVQELSSNDKEQKTLIAELKNEIASLKKELGYGNTPGGNIDSEIETILYQNNPNPFSVDTEIKMSLPENTMNAAVVVYNLEGRQLKNIIVKGRGTTSIKISGSELGAGMYLYALIVDGKVIDTKRMILTQ
jgi:hypothetical protein